MSASNDRTLIRESVHLTSRNALPPLTGAKVYQDTFVGRTAAGYARPLVAGDVFAGIAERRFDNSTADSPTYGVDVVVEENAVIEHAVTGVTGIGDAGKIVYASDDETLTLTALNNSAVGVVRRWVSGSTCIVRTFTPSELALV